MANEFSEFILCHEVMGHDASGLLVRGYYVLRVDQLTLGKLTGEAQRSEPGFILHF